MNKYNDPLKVFVEMKLNRLTFFKNLPRHIKNEFIFNMIYETREQGEYIGRIGRKCK